MKKKMIKKLAVYMAFFQLFTTGLAKGENNNSKLVLINSNKDNPIYQRFDSKTNIYTNISIFDKDNIKTHQYGANQKVFQSHYHQLINNPIIWNEMQNIFKIDNLEKETANLFYQFYFDIISEHGCGYASITNYVFRLFEGKEKEFYKTFGYPMYEVTDQYIDFNYEIFMLKFFNYYIKSTNSVDAIKNTILRKVYQYKIDEYTSKKKDHRKKFDEFKKMTTEEYHKWKKTNSTYKNNIKKYQEKIKKIPDINRGYGLPLEITLGNLVKYLKQYGINIKVTLTNNSHNSKIDEIIASENYTLYEESFYGLEKYDYRDTGPHYLYITNITNDGKIIVSSWGDMYIFDNKKSLWTTKVNIKTLTKH